MIRRNPMRRTAGSAEFVQIGYGSDARTVFRELVEDAQDEYGHGGYTGTIAEKASYRIVSEPMPKDDAYAYAETHTEDFDKYDPAGCVPFVESKVVAEKDFEVKIKAKTKAEAMKIAEEGLKQGQKRAGATIMVKFTKVEMTSPGGKGSVTMEPSTAPTQYKIVGLDMFDERSRFSTKEKAIAEYKRFVVAHRLVDTTCRLVKEEQLAVFSGYVPSEKLPTFTLTGKRTQYMLGTQIKGYVFFGQAAD